MARTRRHGSRTKKHSRKHSSKGYRKGSKSKTMKGKKDFSTKKSSKVFNRRGHYQKHAQGAKKHRRPFRKHGGGCEEEACEGDLWAVD